MSRQAKLFNEAKDLREPKADDAIEQWIARLSKNDAGEVWQNHFDFLKAAGIPTTDALIITWLSIDKTSRARTRLSKLYMLADFMGISRQTLSDRIRKHKWGPAGEEQDLNQWADAARNFRLMLLVPDVEKRLYLEAVRPHAQPATMKLFLQLAGVLREGFDLHHMGADDGPVEYTDLSDAEREAIRDGLVRAAEGGGSTG
jgi:hypothetical protein